jgi:hypothetical protein
MTAFSFSNVESPYGFPDWFAYIGHPSASGSMTWTSLTYDTSWKVQNKMIWFAQNLNGTTGGTAGTGLIYTVPITPVTAATLVAAGILDGGSQELGWASPVVAGAYILCRHADSSNWGLGANRQYTSLIGMIWT